jgi:hypothetical protein
MLRDQAVDLLALLSHLTSLLIIQRPLRHRPDRRRKMAVPIEARNHMSVQVRNHVAQRGQVDLVGLKLLAQSLFHHHHRLHADLALLGRQV